MKRNLRITWTSNIPTASSGYSQQSADIKRKFLESGWDGSNFALINNFGQSGYIAADTDGVRNYPGITHVGGSDAMVHHGNHFQTDVSFGLFDIWVQNPQDLAQTRRFIPWVPIDYDPVPPPILQNLRFAYRIIAMSKFGQKQLRENGYSSVYIPHHVDTKLFRPLDKNAIKAKMQIDPRMFVFGMISANKDMIPRKSFGQVLQAFAQFIKKYPDSLLYIHTNPDQPGGYPLRRHVEMLGLQQKVIFPDLYKREYTTSKEDMNNLMNMFDVLLSPSSTEGFCIPVIEAQACGVPVIVNDYTSMPELVIPGETGYITKVGCEHLMPVGSFMKFPDAHDLYEKMVKIKGMNLEVMGKAARKHVVNNYDLDTIWKTKWLPFLNSLEKEIYGSSLTEPTKTA